MLSKVWTKDLHEQPGLHSPASPPDLQSEDPANEHPHGPSPRLTREDCWKAVNLWSSSPLKVRFWALGQTGSRWVQGKRSRALLREDKPLPPMEDRHVVLFPVSPWAPLSVCLFFCFLLGSFVSTPYVFNTISSSYTLISFLCWRSQRAGGLLGSYPDVEDNRGWWEERGSRTSVSKVTSVSGSGKHMNLILHRFSLIWLGDDVTFMQSQL